MIVKVYCKKCSSELLMTKINNSEADESCELNLHVDDCGCVNAELEKENEELKRNLQYWKDMSETFSIIAAQEQIKEAGE